MQKILINKFSKSIKDKIFMDSNFLIQLKFIIFNFNLLSPPLEKLEKLSENIK